MIFLNKKFKNLHTNRMDNSSITPFRDLWIIRKVMNFFIELDIIIIKTNISIDINLI